MISAVTRQEGNPRFKVPGSKHQKADRIVLRMSFYKTATAIMPIFASSTFLPYTLLQRQGYFAEDSNNLN